MVHGVQLQHSLAANMLSCIVTADDDTSQLLYSTSVFVL